MRFRDNEEKVWPIFEIGPILQYYGGDEVDPTEEWRPYKCPFHGDRTPSASVNGYLKIFRCHMCDVRGNAVQCIMKHEGMSYKDALERTKEITGESDSPVRDSPRRGRRVSQGKGDRAGSRAFRRTWRSS